MLASTAFKNQLLDSLGHSKILTNNAAGTPASARGRLYIYGGTDPGDADAVLDLTAGTGAHTLLGTITADAGVGTTNCSFAATSGGVLAKAVAETWSTGNMVFHGGGTLTGTRTATFARFCSDNTNATSVWNSTVPSVVGNATTTPRLHLTIRQSGEPQGDINLVSSGLVLGANFILDAFQIQL